MRKSTGSYPSLTVDTTAKRVVSHAGAMLLAATTDSRDRAVVGMFVVKSAHVMVLRRADPR